MKLSVHAIPHQSALWAASFPPGEAKGVARIRPRFHKTITAYRETPLRLAKSRLAAVARVHGACGRTRQALWACQLPFQERLGKKTFENPGFCGIMPLSLGALYSVETAARRQGRKRLRRGPEK